MRTFKIIGPPRIESVPDLDEELAEFGREHKTKTLFRRAND